MKCCPHAHTMGTTFRVLRWCSPERSIGAMTADMLTTRCPGVSDISVTVKADGLFHKLVRVRVSSNSAAFCSDFIAQCARLTR